MTNKNLKKKIISGVILGSVIISLGVGAFASELNQRETKHMVSSNRGSKMQNKGKRNEPRMKENLKESGIFTESEIEEITTYLENRKIEMNKERENLKNKTKEEKRACHEKNKDHKENIMNELVTNGTITQDQLDQLKEKLPQRNQLKNK